MSYSSGINVNYRETNYLKHCLPLQLLVFQLFHLPFNLTLLLLIEDFICLNLRAALQFWNVQSALGDLLILVTFTPIVCLTWRPTFPFTNHTGFWRYKLTPTTHWQLSATQILSMFFWGGFLRSLLDAFTSLGPHSLSRGIVGPLAIDATQLKDVNSLQPFLSRLI